MRYFSIACFLVATVSSASANCLGPAALPSGDVAKFNAAPGAYFAGMSNAALQETVRKLAASDPAAVPGIMTVFKSSSLATQTAITQGLGLAARDCQANQEQARTIQSVAVDLPSSLRAIFDTFSGQRGVATAGGGGGGGAGGASGGGTSPTGGAGASNSGYSGPTSFSRANSATTIGAGGSSGAAAGSGVTSALITPGTTINVIVPTPTSP